MLMPDLIYLHRYFNQVLLLKIQLSVGEEPCDHPVDNELYQNDGECKYRRFETGRLRIAYNILNCCAKRCDRSDDRSNDRFDNLEPDVNQDAADHTMTTPLATD